jgi:alpha-tubulin suppressor-like RCC1 family protein
VNSQCSAAGRCISCVDGQKNGSETDIDCGGATCGKCSLGQVCSVAGDCASGFCVGGKCAVCNPGATQCSGNAPQTCTATGTWQTGAACGGGTPQCCKGACAATVVDVSAGYSHACARKSDNTLWCWGDNTHGQIGDNSLTMRPTPVQVTALGGTVAQVSAGGMHTCARKTDGTLWCWGYNGNNQLGDGTAVQRLAPVQVTTLGTTVAQVSAGDYNTCARKTDGTLWCWGLQTGNSTTPNSASPVQVTTLGTTVAQVSAGGSHSCARKTDGTLWCWGSNNSGELGDGTITSRATPVQVTTLGALVADVSARGDHTCAVRTDGTGVCWGRNDAGQVGDGTLVDRHTPVQVTTGAASFTGAFYNTCVRKTNGTLFCWGANNHGQVGDSSAIFHTTAASVVLLGNTVAAASAGDYFACAVRSDGTLWCWGYNNSGQLGDGSSITVRAQPERLPLGVCSSDSCNNGVKDGTEGDIDCGGACVAYGLFCATGKHCNSYADCNAVSNCSATNVCTDACTSGDMDLTESDTDCGGLCGSCANGLACNSNWDCTEGNCISYVCEPGI